MASHQQEVSPGPSQSLLQPGQLTVGIHHTQGAPGLLVCIVVRVAAQHYGVEHDDSKGLPSVWDSEVQLIIIRGKFPEIGVKQFNQVSPIKAYSKCLKLIV